MRLSLSRPSQNSSGWKASFLGSNAEEGRLEARPFLLDDAPHEAGREDALGHLGQHPVVGDLASAFWEGTLGSREASTASPPLRLAARARMALKAIMMFAHVNCAGSGYIVPAKYGMTWHHEGHKGNT